MAVLMLTPPVTNPLLVGLSGGLDSSVLLHLLTQHPATRELGLRAIHIHHGLHADADAWAAHCQAACDALAVPLTVVRVASDLLAQEQGLSERGARSLRRIGGAVREMEELIDAFLVLARHPDVPLDSDEIDMAEVAHEQAASALPLLEGKPVALDVVEHAHPRVHAPLRVPGVMLGQLLRNACEHTDQGRIEVRVEADRIEVEDTGAGMDAATLARAFQPFYRGGGTAFAGKGLGLHVVERLGERLGWNVELRSSPGAGTTAIIRFAG